MAGTVEVSYSCQAVNFITLNENRLSFLLRPPGYFLILSKLYTKTPNSDHAQLVFSQLFFSGEEWVRRTEWQGAECVIDNSVMGFICSDG